MKPIFYIPPVNDDCKKLADEVSRQHLPLVTRGDERWPDEGPFFFYGSIEGMKHVQRDFQFIDWCDWSKLACTSYYAKWGDLLLTRDYGFYPLAEVKRQSEALWCRYADRQGYVYFRPNSNDKVFGGGLFHRLLLGPWLLQAESGRLTDDLLCLVGRPTPILEEYRLVVAGGEVVTGSLYLREDRIRYVRACPNGAKVVAEQVAGLWSPHPVFVLDVAYTANGEYRIIECGSIHTAGLYECDLEKVVKAVVSYSSY